jgi:hypothetical protein
VSSILFTLRRILRFPGLFANPRQQIVCVTLSERVPAVNEHKGSVGGLRNRGLRLARLCTAMVFLAGWRSSKVILWCYD